jgi:hypothetical protein
LQQIFFLFSVLQMNIDLVDDERLLQLGEVSVALPLSFRPNARTFSEVNSLVFWPTAVLTSETCLGGRGALCVPSALKPLEPPAAASAARLAQRSGSASEREREREREIQLELDRESFFSYPALFHTRS